MLLGDVTEPPPMVEPMMIGLARCEAEVALGAPQSTGVRHAIPVYGSDVTCACILRSADLAAIRLRALEPSPMPLLMPSTVA